MVKEIHQFEVGWICPECHLARSAEGYDPCIGKLPGVKYACCGHGGKSNPTVCAQGYIYFENGVIIRFDKLTKIEGYQ